MPTGDVCTSGCRSRTRRHAHAIGTPRDLSGRCSREDVVLERRRALARFDPRHVGALVAHEQSFRVVGHNHSCAARDVARVGAQDTRPRGAPSGSAHAAQSARPPHGRYPPARSGVRPQPRAEPPESAPPPHTRVMLIFFHQSRDQARRPRLPPGRGTRYPSVSLAPRDRAASPRDRAASPRVFPTPSHPRVPPHPFPLAQARGPRASPSVPFGWKVRSTVPRRRRRRRRGRRVSLRDVRRAVKRRVARRVVSDGRHRRPGSNPRPRGTLARVLALRPRPDAGGGCGFARRVGEAHRDATRGARRARRTSNRRPRELRARALRRTHAAARPRPPIAATSAAFASAKLPRRGRRRHTIRLAAPGPGTRLPESTGGTHTEKNARSERGRRRARGDGAHADGRVFVCVSRVFVFFFPEARASSSVIGDASFAHAQIQRLPRFERHATLRGGRARGGGRGGGRRRRGVPDGADQDAREAAGATTRRRARRSSARRRRRRRVRFGVRHIGAIVVDALGTHVGRRRGRRARGRERGRERGRKG